MIRSHTNEKPASRKAQTDESPGRDDIAPGLLRVLQQAAGLRAVTAALALSIFVMGRSAGRLPWFEADWLPWTIVVQAGAFLAFVLWGRVRQVLGAVFLPIALGWFLVAPIVEQVLMLRSVPAALIEQLGRGGIAGIGYEGLFVVIPVILATWQYGRRGLLASLGVLTAGQVILAPMIGGDPVTIAFYLLNSLGRVGMIALLGYVVLQLVSALRREHLGLAAANRQLAQRAATAEQLAESRERNRLARELHDTLAHSLTGLSVQLKALETLLIHDPAAAGGQLKEAQATVRTGLQEARRAIQALRATPLEDLGLAEALRQLCTRMGERTGLRAECDITETPALDPLTEQAIYRVAEAALANVEEHAGAQVVHVGLAAPEGRVRLTVGDDGVGFDPTAVRGDRYGLAGMAERAELIGASLQVDSRPGQGTCVNLEVAV